MKSEQRKLSSAHELPWRRRYTFERQMRYVSQNATSYEVRSDMMKSIVDTSSQSRAWQQSPRDTKLPHSLPSGNTEEGKNDLLLYNRQMTSHIKDCEVKRTLQVTYRTLWLHRRNTITPRPRTQE